MIRPTILLYSTRPHVCKALGLLINTFSDRLSTNLTAKLVQGTKRPLPMGLRRSATVHAACTARMPHFTDALRVVGVPVAYYPFSGALIPFVYPHNRYRTRDNVWVRSSLVFPLCITLLVSHSSKHTVLFYFYYALSLSFCVVLGHPFSFWTRTGDFGHHWSLDLEKQANKEFCHNQKTFAPLEIQDPDRDFNKVISKLCCPFHHEFQIGKEYRSKPISDQSSPSP